VVTGHILFGSVDEGAVHAVPFVVSRLEVTGPALSVIEGVVVKAGGAAEVAISRSGTLVYAEVTGSELVRVDRTGTVRMIVRGPGRFHSPRVSPRGDRIALGMVAGGESNVWVYELASQALTRLTRGGTHWSPVWASDGTRVLWLSSSAYRGASNTSKLMWQRWDGAGSADSIPSDGTVRSADIPMQRNFLVTAGPAGVWLESLPPGGERRRVDAARSGPVVEVSPDGRWLA
jgi:Tol biopolymer transport system component